MPSRHKGQRNPMTGKAVPVPALPIRNDAPVKVPYQGKPGIPSRFYPKVEERAMWSLRNPFTRGRS